VSDGRVVQVNVSSGGVPKRAVDEARVTRLGLEGDRQREATVHGGPHRAVCLLGIEAIERVAGEGHPIGPGSTGENLTTAGFDASLLPIGTRLHVGAEVVLELASPTAPCRTIRHSFADHRFSRLSVVTHPADSRVYARVIVEGVVRPGDDIRLEAPTTDRAERHAVASRLDGVERSSSLAVWRSAVASGADVAVLDDGDIAVAAASTLPGSIFNTAIGFAHLPNLVDRAVEHFGRHGVTGWVWLEEDPWSDAIVDVTATLSARSLDASGTHGGEPADGTVVRELGRDEVGPWSEVIAAAAGLSPPVARAWVALEGPLAAAPHHHRFVAERDGQPVGAASLHTHHGAAWLRSATVLPGARGVGIQRALIAARLERAHALGCDLAGSLAEAGTVSARNLERLGFRPVAERRRYRVEPSDRIA
jgi:MOSC domain-containing protein YiiM/GNAT superfamily N-acetyltransferase